ncbi:hypothetical protein PO124_14575 [Bacillus licheniformis]|nr:hypothetical protein [Bacillus licheniformis]
MEELAALTKRPTERLFPRSRRSGTVWMLLHISERKVDELAVLCEELSPDV